ncbi:MAG: FtsX-like permease family protein [Acidimicrobiales bacterium]
MKPHALKVGGYRFRATLSERWTSYLSLILLIAILGGVAMGTVDGARRTETSFTTLLDRQNASQLEGPLQIYNPPAGYTTGYSVASIDKVRHLPHVKQVESLVGLNAYPLGPRGQTLPGDQGFSPDGNVSGLQLDQDRLILQHGHLPIGHNANEFVADSGTIHEFRWHLGETVTFAYYTNEASVTAAPRGPKVAGHFKARLVGTGAVQPGNLVQDQVDNIDRSILIFSSSLTRHYLKCCANSTVVGIQLNGGSRYDSQVQKAFERAFPNIGVTLETATSIVARVSRSISPEALALAVFGLLTALAALAVASQLISRLVRLAGNESRIIRAMGADPRTTFVDGLFGTIIAVVTGSLLAVAIALALSPLAPIGPTRPYLGAHFNADWTVLGAGFAIFVVALSAVTAAFSYRSQSHRVSKGARRPSRGDRAPTRVAGASGLPIAVVTGVGFALETGGTRRTVPMRSAIVGAAIALIIVGATTTFATSLRTLVSNPPLYGWNWSAALDGGGGVGDIPSAIVKPLAQDPDIAVTSNAYFAVLLIDGKPVPVMGEIPDAAIQPAQLSGHNLEDAGQVVLGASTMEMLHKSIGDTVVATSGGSKKTTLRIVGTATMPAFGQAGSAHLEMGIGAVMNYTLIPLAKRDIFDNPPGPNAILIRYRPGVSSAQGAKSIQHAVSVASGGNAPGNLIDRVERPSEIVDYRSLGNTPIELGAVLAGGALVALGLTLMSSVRRRRRDIALLKALGFSRRQVFATVATQSTIAVGLGALIGIPLGIVIGRTLWDLFANTIHAVPRVVVPTSTLIIVAVVALALANAVAALPARIAARTPPAILLRAE